MGETGTGGSLLGVGEGEREPAVAAMAVCLFTQFRCSCAGEVAFGWF